MGQNIIFPSRKTYPEEKVVAPEKLFEFYKIVSNSFSDTH